MTRPRLPSNNEMSLSSSKTHRRTSSVICNGKIHSDRSDDTITMMDCNASPNFGEGRLRPGSDIISSLRALELIRQLSFDTSTPKIIDILGVADTENAVASPSTMSKYLPGLLEFECVPPAPPTTPRIVSPPLPPIVGRKEPRAVSPPIYLVVNNRDRARSTSLSEMSDSDGYVTDFDGMMVVMEPLPDQTGQPRRRLASDQSPYAVSSASSSSCDDLSSASSTEREMFDWNDPTGCVIDLGMNHADASKLKVTQDDVVGPPSCTRLSIDSLQEWDLLCEQEGNIINKRQYITTALSPTPCPTLMVGEQSSSSQESVEEVHMILAPSLSASLSYTHTGAPSTISISSELHDVEEEMFSTNCDSEPLSYSQSIDKSFESSLAGDIDHIHPDATSPSTLRNRHRRHRSDGLVFLSKSSHQRRNSFDISLQIIPESPNGVDVAGQFVGTTSAVCDNSFEGFVTSGVPLEMPCSTNLFRAHRRFNSDGHLARRGRRLQQ